MSVDQLNQINPGQAVYAQDEVGALRRGCTTPRYLPPRSTR
jgi:hypothetical protein